MLPSAVEQMLIGAMILQTLSAAVSAMSKPKRDDGWYSWLYKFSHQIVNMADAAFEKRFNVTMPRVVDETATQTVTTPTTQIETAVTKTTTNP